jgi:quercetin dioxygenase-like cupin family protein
MPGKRKVTVVRPGEGESVQVVGDTYRFLASGRESDRSYMLMEASVPPGAGPPLHSHEHEEEGFYVLEGEMEFHADGESLRAGPGTFVNLPKGSRHRFTNVGPSPARMLILCAPAGIEAFFREVDGKGPDELLEAAPRYGLKIYI